MSRTNELGRTVYLLGALAETSPATADLDKPTNFPVSLTGLFIVEEYMGYEPSAYVWSPGYLVVPADADHDDPDGMMYFVGIDEYESQANPSSYARSLSMERDMANAEEREYARK